MGVTDFFLRPAEDGGVLSIDAPLDSRLLRSIPAPRALDLENLEREVARQRRIVVRGGCGHTDYRGSGSWRRTADSWASDWRVST